MESIPVTDTSFGDRRTIGPLHENKLEQGQTVYLMEVMDLPGELHSESPETLRYKAEPIDKGARQVTSWTKENSKVEPSQDVG